ncbi:MAG TPA: recombination mediator RecR [Candidatus Saccharimonadales bacterium]|nr:recombination mediator RecR [Candidatus Saccharimonadales bacterium]
MQILPPALQDLIDAFGLLPGVGPRTAERYAYYLLRHGADSPAKLAAALQALPGGIGYCKKTFALVPAGQDLSDLYTDPRRDKQTVAVVAEPFDLVALEKTGQFHGTYHVLGGLVSPIDGVGPDQLHIRELVKRIDEDKVKEVILATNASVEGESTALYIQQQIGPGRKVKVTRLARGLPIGVDLEYADQITLGRALEGRQTV